MNNFILNINKSKVKNLFLNPQKNKKTTNVHAGNRTRADALEERHTNHYTTWTFHILQHIKIHFLNNQQK